MICRNDDYYHTSETDISLSDEEINKQRNLNKLKRVFFLDFLKLFY